MKFSQTDGLEGVKQLNGFPDLTPLDVFYGILKRCVYKTKFASGNLCVEELKQRTTDETSLITVDILRNVRDSF